MKDPYEAQRQACLEKGGHTTVKGHHTCCADDNVSVHHPVQPKTQVERWGEEFDRNVKEIFNCCGYVFNSESGAFEIKNLGRNCPKQGTDRCSERNDKNKELGELISKDHEEKSRFIGRTPTGTFTDDKCNCAEITCKVGCKENHTHKTFSCENCNPKVTLLDKIKKLLCRISN